MSSWFRDTPVAMKSDRGVSRFESIDSELSKLPSVSGAVCQLRSMEEGCCSGNVPVGRPATCVAPLRRRRDEIARRLFAAHAYLLSISSLVVCPVVGRFACVRDCGLYDAGVIPRKAISYAEVNTGVPQTKAIRDSVPTLAASLSPENSFTCSLFHCHLVRSLVCQLASEPSVLGTQLFRTVLTGRYLFRRLPRVNKVSGVRHQALLIAFRSWCMCMLGDGSGPVVRNRSLPELAHFLAAYQTSVVLCHFGLHHGLARSTLRSWRTPMASEKQCVSSFKMWKGLASHLEAVLYAVRPTQSVTSCDMDMPASVMKTSEQ